MISSQNLQAFIIRVVEQVFQMSPTNDSDKIEEVHNIK